MTPINEFPLYSVTEHGAVYSNVNNAGNKRDNPYELTICTDRDGYSIVQLHGNTRKVHRLVALTFLPNPDSLPQVNHIDGNKQNNSVTNLEWCTAAENSQHAINTGLRTVLHGEEASQAKLTNEQTIELIEMTLDGKSNEEIGAKFDLHPRYVSLVRHKKRQLAIWEEHFSEVSPVNSSKLVNSKDPKVLESIVDTAFTTTRSNKSIGEEFNVDASTISRIRNNDKRVQKYFLPYMEKHLKRGNSQTTIEST